MGLDHTDHFPAEGSQLKGITDLIYPSFGAIYLIRPGMFADSRDSVATVTAFTVGTTVDAGTRSPRRPREPRGDLTHRRDVPVEPVDVPDLAGAEPAQFVVVLQGPGSG